MDPHTSVVNDSSQCLPEASSAVCVECGHRFKSIAEQLRVGDCTFICDQCYKRLSFPESVIRCPD